MRGNAAEPVYLPNSVLFDMYKPHRRVVPLACFHNLFTNSLDGGGKSGAGRFRSYFEPTGHAVSILKQKCRVVLSWLTSGSSWWSVGVRMLPFL